MCEEEEQPLCKKIKLELFDEEDNFFTDSFFLQDVDLLDTPLLREEEEIMEKPCMTTLRKLTVYELLQYELASQRMMYPQFYFNNTNCAGWIPNVEEVLRCEKPRQVIRVKTNKSEEQKGSMNLRNKKQIVEQCLRCGEGISDSLPMLHCRNCNHFQVMYNGRIYNAMWCNSRKLVALLTNDETIGTDCICKIHKGLRLVNRVFVQLIIGNLLLNVL